MKIIPLKAEDTWQIRHEVMWPNHPLAFVKLPEDKEGDHYGLEIDEQLVSIISLFHKNTTVQFRKFATLKTQQGKGYGTYLLNHIINHILVPTTTVFWCNARIDKSSYYERFGLSKTNQTYTKGGIEFVIMKKLFTNE